MTAQRMNIFSFAIVLKNHTNLNEFRIIKAKVSGRESWDHRLVSKQLLLKDSDTSFEFLESC